MQNNSTTHTENPALDAEDWQIAFEPYQGNHRAAITLGFNLAMLRAYMDAQPIKSRQAIEAIDLALEVLFSHTSFCEVSFDLFIRFTEGKLTFDEEQMLNALGVKF